MKRIILVPFLMFSLFSSSQVIFAGFIVNSEDKKMKDVAINLYEGNEIVSTEKWNKKFEYDLDLEKNYVLELKKEGFVAKRIAISTFEGDKGMEKEKKGIDAVDTDFPSALIEYKKSQGRFTFDSKYAKNKKKTDKQSADIKKRK